MLQKHFQMLARYNTLANRRIYDACALLSDAERKRARPAFFKSIHGTLNHIMVGDRIWLTRFAGEKIPSTGLDAILYEDFAELSAVRRLEDRRIENFAAGLTEEFIKGTIKYVNNQGKLYEDPVELLITHFFNHQTHHRGQIHDMLTQTEIAPPVLDMHRIINP
ncbi:damage-inducible protein DinB [Phormidium sp. LEGE 05292]|uniref:DinB family protein n=1 Tax=[Phormidium] sp. LEGE 05292 TaxID=767427 RepID=UPI00187E8419|nr:DinB family protein [Phormidium sp. LEGE 05292]MBE9229220.1 damage-inducible protein DinB [Phormidium sp. LEGE 05292]